MTVRDGVVLLHGISRTSRSFQRDRCNSESKARVVGPMAMRFSSAIIRLMLQ